MIYSYEEIIAKYKNNYQLGKVLEKEEIFKIEPGLYSDQKFVNYLLIINKKYPNAVFTSDSAYYYHNLTDVIPQSYFLATHRKAAKIIDNKVKQIYVPEDIFDVGISTIKVNGIEIKIYDKEKLLIELVKNSEKIPFDYYKEIINNYREIKDELNIKKISEYISNYAIEDYLYDVIIKEVF